MSLALLVAVGAVGGILAPRRSPWLAAFTLAVFPLIVVVDFVDDPTSHNLWPFEFMFYAAEALLAVGAAAITRLVRGRSARALPPETGSRSS